MPSKALQRPSMRTSVILLCTCLGLAACGGGGGGGGGSDGSGGASSAAPLAKAPAIVAQPAPQSAEAGGSVTFSVGATGSDLTYQWRRDDKDIPGATAASYTLTGVQPADANNTYAVIVTNTSGSVYSAQVAAQIAVPKGLSLLAAEIGGGKGNVDGPAPRFDAIGAIAMSPSGMLLMVDAPGVRGRLRSLDPATGATTAVMTYAEGTVPRAMVFDAAGNRYEMADWAVYKTTPAGARMRLAGGLSRESRILDEIGTDARFSALSDMTIDGAGNLYVIDAGTRIRKINPAGQVTTLTGSRRGTTAVDGDRDTAVFVNASGLAVDQAGNVYVLDGGHNLVTTSVRKVTPDGTVSTIPLKEGGDSLAQIAGGDQQLTFDANGNLLMTASEFSAGSPGCRIRKVALDGTVTTLAGKADARGNRDGKGEAAQFCGYKRALGRMAADKSGNVYVYDVGNTSVRRITAAGDVTTVAGRSDWEYRDYNGGKGRVLRFEVAYQSGNPPAPYLGQHHHLAADAQGNVYLGEGRSIWKFTPAGAIGSPPRTFENAEAHYPGALAYGGGTLSMSYGLISRTDADGVTRLVTSRRGMFGDKMVDGAVDKAVLMQPYDLIMDGKGNIYLHDANPGDLRAVQRKISAEGVVTTLPADAAEGHEIVTWHADKDGFVWAATVDGSVFRIEPDGRRTQVRAATHQSPTAITRDAAGNLYLAMAESANPVDERGTWYVVRKIAPDGSEKIVAGTEGSSGVRLGGAGSLGLVDALAVAPDGRIYLMSERALLTLMP